MLPINAVREHGRALVRDRPVKLVGGIGKQLDAVLDQIIGDRVERDAGLLQLGEDAPGVLDIFLKAVAHLAVVAEGLERRRRHGIDGVGADQLLDIEHVAIVLVFCAGRGPQQALRPCALGLELLPARPGEQALVFLIGEFCIRDGDLAFQRRKPLLLGRIVRLRDLLVEQFVDRTVDAADEETGDARDMGGIATAGDVFFQSSQIGLGDLHIDLPREQQRDVDADPLAGQMLDRRQAFRRRRHLDHQIFAVDVLPEQLGLGNRAPGIHGEIGRYLQADETVGSLETVIDRAQHIRRMLDVLDGEMLEQLGNRAIAAFQRLADRTVILVGTADRLLEDRRIRRDALDAVIIDQPFQLALDDEAAGQEIEPDRLAVLFQCFDGIHDALFCSRLLDIGFHHLFWRDAEFCQQIHGRALTGSNMRILRA